MFMLLCEGFDWLQFEKFYLFIYLDFIYSFERERVPLRENELGWGCGGRGGEGQSMREKEEGEAGSLLSGEPNTGLNPRVGSRPEPEADA